MLSGILAASSLAAMACTDDSLRSATTEPTPVGSTTATQATEVSRLRLRPLSLPSLPSGAPCPVTTDSSTPSSALGTMWGTGTARPVLGSQPRIAIAPPANFGSQSWGGNNVVGALSADSTATALVRGHQLDGAAVARFDDGAIPPQDKILDPKGKTPLDGGWYDFPGYVRMQEPGCYGFQIDRGDAASVILVLEAWVGD
jgi:hypothetical protein